MVRTGPLMRLVLLALVLVPGAFPQSSSAPRVVATGLDAPWEVVWGPDNYLWITERIGKRIIRVHPDTGEKSVALRLTEASQELEQDGVLGLALHPQLLAGSNYVYVYFTYLNPSAPGIVRSGKVRRYTYNPATATLGEPKDLLTALPVHDDHVSGRLAFGPDGKLFFSVGDQGANFARNACRPNRAQQVPTAKEVAAQDWTRYQGKLLRINLDGSIPSDNPVIGGVRSHIYSYGHRNIQGIAFSPAGTLYTAEHGPSTDDELNRIQAGKNYGWPNVAGFKDDKAYAYSNWAAAPNCASLRYNPVTAPPDVPTQPESAFTHPDFVAPLQTFFTLPDAGSVTKAIGTAALSGIAFYSSSAIPPLTNSVLLTGMRTGIVYAQKLDASGNSAAGPPRTLYRSANRPRDLAISPDGKRIFAVTDATGRVSIAPGNVTATLENPGALLELQLP